MAKDYQHTVKSNIFGREERLKQQTSENFKKMKEKNPYINFKMEGQSSKGHLQKKDYYRNYTKRIPIFK